MKEQFDTQNSKTEFTFSYRVRYADVDRMSVAYHSRYFEWFEAARTELLREKGFPYKKIEEMGFSLPVIEAHCQYVQPVRYDDLLEIVTIVAHVSRLKVKLSYSVYVSGQKQICANRYTLHCFINKHGKPVRIHPDLMNIFK